MYQVVWRGIIHDTQGYARASREYLLALDRAGVDVKIEPLNFGTPPARLLPEQAKRLRELVAKPLAKDKKKVLIYHCQPYGVNAVEERRKGYDKVIINTVWETTVVPDNWFPYINLADGVIVPSKQNVEALQNSGVKVPIYLVPHGADIESYSPDNEPFQLEDVDGKFKFLSVFQWQHRKGPGVLMRAFWKEFSSKDDVTLIMKTYWGNSGLKSDQRAVRQTIREYKYYLGLNDTAPIHVSGSLFSDTEMKGLYTLADAYVLPSRGEGVGLPYIEAMSSGIPCIATGWGGQTDFISNQNGYLIDYTLVGTQDKVADEIAPNFFDGFHNGMQWAEPDEDHLRKLMRQAYTNQEEVKAKGIQARKDMEKLTWDNVGVILKSTIDKVVL